MICAGGSVQVAENQKLVMVEDYNSSLKASFSELADTLVGGVTPQSKEKEASRWPEIGCRDINVLLISLASGIANNKVLNSFYLLHD